MRRQASLRAQALNRPNVERDLEASLSPTSPKDPMDIKLDKRTSVGSREDITALPVSRELRTSPHLRPVTQDNEGIPYNFHLPGSTSHSSAPSATRGKLQRENSGNKRAAMESPLPRRLKAPKKRKDEYVREEEIRAMSAPVPIPKRHGDGGLLRRDSKKFRGGLNRNFERPTSNISLPLEESIHSSMSAHSDSRNYRVSLLDVVSPRPTLRYSLNTPYVSGGMSQNTWNTPTRSESRRSQKRPYPGKDIMKESRTIDALADDLDAKELREIMERDNRRRERKRKTDAERLQRKLERKAEKDRRKELRTQEDATGESGKKAKETEQPAATGLGIDSQDQAISPGEQPQRPPIPEKSQERLRRANNEAQSRLEAPMDMAVSTTAKPTTRSSADNSPPVSPSRVESRTDTVPSQPSSFPQSYTSEPTPPPSAPRREPETGTKRGGMWSSIFRRDPTRRKSSADRGRERPSKEASFTNTSRDSMSRQVPPAHLYQPPSQSSSKPRSRSDTPIRTQSKFREELPEMPLSPPDSRVQSPEATSAAGAAIAVRRGFKAPAVKTDVPVSGQRLSSPSEEPLSQGRTDSPVSARGSNLMSQSLASIDSEGSWLSGKAMNRLSSKARKYHSGGSSSAGRLVDDFAGSHEELGYHDDEYSGRLTPQPGENRRASGLSASALAHKASSNAMAPEDEEEDPGLDTDEELQNSPPRARREDDDAHTVVHGGVGRHPTVVHRDIRVKSSEGLLNQYNKQAADTGYTTPPASPKKADHAAGETNGDGEAPAEEFEGAEPASLQRASSVKVGGKGHARQISAGSAKLLDIPKRASQSSSRAPSAGPPTPKPEAAAEESKS